MSSALQRLSLLGVLSGPQGTVSRNTAETARGFGSREPAGLLKLQTALVAFIRSRGPGVCDWSRGKWGGGSLKISPWRVFFGSQPDGA